MSSRGLLAAQGSVVVTVNASEVSRWYLRQQGFEKERKVVLQGRLSSMIMHTKQTQGEVTA